MAYNKFLASSNDPQQLSLTIKGAVAFIPLAVILLSTFGFSATPEDLTHILTELATLASGAVTIYGLVRKIVNSRIPNKREIG